MVRVTIHHTNPFATPEEHRSPARRLRGRLPAAVTLWTASDSTGPAGLTISSTVVADGAPAHVLGLVDGESDLLATIEATEAFAVTLLTQADRQLADRFAGLLPAPGGLFRGALWRETPYGPIPADHQTWVGCHLVRARQLGWALLVEGAAEHIEVGDDEPLVHHRGRYRRLG